MPPNTRGPSLSSGWSPDVDALRAKYGEQVVSNPEALSQAATAETVGGVLQGIGTAGVNTILGMVGLAKQVVNDPVGSFNSAKESVTDFVSDPAAIPGKVANAASDEYNRVVDTVRSGPQGLGQVLFEYLPNPLGRTTSGVPKRDIFIGPNARDWDQASNDLARRMELDGAPPEEIWKATGNIRGEDNMWRQEADTSDASFKMSGFRRVLAGGTTPLPDLYSSPAFERNYPNLFNKIGVTGYNLPDADWSGAINGGELAVNTSLIRSPGAVARAIWDRAESQKKLMEHELQHAVQGVEGWGAGGSTSLWQQRKNLLSDVPAQIGGLRVVDGDHLPYTPPNEIAGFYYKQVNNARNPYLSVGERRKAYETAIEIQQIWNPYSMYKNLSGEVEARLAENRRRMTNAERRDNFPVLQEKDSELEVLRHAIQLDTTGTPTLHTVHGGVDSGDLSTSVLMGYSIAFPEDNPTFTGLRARANTNAVLTPLANNNRRVGRATYDEEPLQKDAIFAIANRNRHSPTSLSYKAWLAEKIGDTPDHPDAPRWIAELRDLESGASNTLSVEGTSIPPGESLESLLRSQR